MKSSFPKCDKRPSKKGTCNLDSKFTDYVWEKSFSHICVLICVNISEELFSNKMISKLCLGIGNSIFGLALNALWKTALSLFFPLSLSVSVCPSVSLSLAVSCSVSRALSLVLTLALYLSLSVSHSLTLALSISLPLAL